MTPANPHLKLPNRDITTSGGLSLTLVNPAYMTRQVNELAMEMHDFQGHIVGDTVGKYLRPVSYESVPEHFMDRNKPKNRQDSLNHGRYCKIK